MVPARRRGWRKTGVDFAYTYFQSPTTKDLAQSCTTLRAHRILFPVPRVRRRANKHAGDTRSDIQYPRLSPRESLRPDLETSIRRIQFLLVSYPKDIIDTVAGEIIPTVFSFFPLFYRFLNFLMKFREPILTGRVIKLVSTISYLSLLFGIDRNTKMFHPVYICKKNCEITLKILVDKFL